MTPPDFYNQVCPGQLLAYGFLIFISLWQVPRRCRGGLEWGPKMEKGNLLFRGGVHEEGEVVERTEEEVEGLAKARPGKRGPKHRKQFEDG